MRQWSASMRSTMLARRSASRRRTWLRLISIDALESAQNCQRDGKDYACRLEATVALRELIRGKHVRCDETAGIATSGPLPGKQQAREQCDHDSVNFGLSTLSSVITRAKPDFPYRAFCDRHR
jgi:hypothetical protein